jgi:glutathione synthase/RimK-type ligase-like ATP-grasp enzyme
MKIGFLACEGTLPGSPRRRADAHEHDLQVNALEPALAERGHTLAVIDWRAPMEAFDDIPLLLLGTVWDYQDNEVEFLAKLDALEAAGITICNSPETLRWNIDKNYLARLAGLGAATIPTIWVEEPTARDITSALEKFQSDSVVVKRQVGAGAEGQSIFRRADALDPNWSMSRAAMIQPFQPAIQSEGEYSFVFVDGEFSHCTLKRAASGDYRIQSLYGGTEQKIDPPATDKDSAAQIINLLPLPTPLYARIDMVRGNEGQLLLMEAELIEPYLYPEQGPELGPRMANGIEKRLKRR